MLFFSDKEVKVVHERMEVNAAIEALIRTRDLAYAKPIIDFMRDIPQTVKITSKEWKKTPSSGGVTGYTPEVGEVRIQGENEEQGTKTEIIGHEPQRAGMYKVCRLSETVLMFWRFDEGDPDITETYEHGRFVIEYDADSMEPTGFGRRYEAGVRRTVLLGWFLVIHRIGTKELSGRITKNNLSFQMDSGYRGTYSFMFALPAAIVAGCGFMLLGIGIAIKSCADLFF